MQLGKAEALGVFDDHDAGVGHVDAHFHHGGGDEYVRFAPAEGFEARVLFRRLHATVDERHAGLGQQLAQFAVQFLRVAGLHGLALVTRGQMT